MPIKCKKGKVRYRRIKFKDIPSHKHKRYLQLIYCSKKGKRGKLVEAKLKPYKKLKKIL